ncbi:MAG TPA: OmpA family protein, partial [Leptospiraceae bacterium]|nr:OmpA family protein [Leptospiraceae bacterium]
KENFTKLTLLGHTDLTGNSENNLILSQRRAESVKKYLIEKGVAQNKIFAKGLGSTKPLVNLSDEEASKKNRRIEFVLE